jgi:hypothetical protein
MPVPRTLPRGCCRRLDAQVPNSASVTLVTWHGEVLGYETQVECHSYLSVTPVPQHPEGQT